MAYKDPNYVRKWQARNPDKVKLYAKTYRQNHRDEILRRAKEKLKKAPLGLHKYGMTKDQYMKVHKAQRGKCSICARRQAKPWRWLCVDHDHETGRFRGLVCMRCNTALGWFEALRDKIMNHLIEQPILM